MPAPRPSAIPSSRVLFSASFTVLFAVILHRLSVLQTVILFPIFVVFSFALIAVSLVVSATRSGRVPGAYEQERRRHALRQLTFATPSAWSAFLTKKEWEESFVEGGFGTSESGSNSSPLRSKFPPVYKLAGPGVNKRLDSILILIKRSFVLPWYTRLSPSPAFPDVIEGIIRHALGQLVKRAEQVDWPNVIVSRILPIITDHLQHYRSVEHLAVTGTNPSEPSSSVLQSALPLPLPTQVHDALRSQIHLGLEASVASIETHFRAVLGPVIHQLIPEKERTAVIGTLVREILVGTIMLPVFEMLCDSDFWNKQIDDKVGKYLHEQKQVDQFLSALSSLPQHFTSSTSSKKPSSPLTQRTPASTSISSHSSTKQFDDFMKSIPKLKTLGEARRLRADVDRELRSARASLTMVLASSHDGKDGDKRLKRAERYVHRLEKARSQIDGRIAVLSGQPTAPSSLILPPPPPLAAEFATNVTLYAILSDPSSLAYWLEHMERRGRSRLLQFWLTVEGFKDPLESVGQHSALESVLDSSLPPAVTGSTLEEDISFLYQAYFVSPSQSSPMAVPLRHVQTIVELATRLVVKEEGVNQANRLSPIDARRAKHAMYAAQKAVYEQMEDEDWKSFQASELFLKAVAELKKVSPPPPAHTSRARSLSPHLSPSTDLVPPVAPTYAPPQPNRQLTAPIPSSSRLPDVQHPTVLRRPHLINGTFTPGPSMVPSASVTTATPHFDVTTRGSRQNTPVESRATSLTSPMSVPATPPPIQRGLSHLDFLISGEPTGDKPEERSKLFDDDDGDETHGDDGDNDDFVLVQRMEAIQAALNEIIAADDMFSSRHVEPKQSTIDTDPLRSPSASMILPPRPTTDSTGSKLKTSRSVEDLQTIRAKATATAPRVASAGHTGTSFSSENPSLARRNSMSKILLGLDKPKHIFDDEGTDEDEVEDTQDIIANDALDVVQLAAPGDLQLSVEIARLQDKIQDLVKHEGLLDSLIRRAELTGNQKELRLLQRSLSSIRREQRTAIFQKAQFEQQEEENRLVPGRTRVRIPSSVVTTEEGEVKGVVRYTVEVSQVDENGRIGLSWVVARRYNEFWELDKAIREWALASGDQLLQDEIRTRIVDIPGKRLVSNMSASFVESRRTGLERYMQSLISSSRICEGPHLRGFLSQSSVRVSTITSAGVNSTAAFSSLAPHNLVKSIYKTMASSLDDALLGPSMLDLMSHTLGRQLSDVAEGIGGLVGEELAGFMPNALKGSNWAKPIQESPVAHTQGRSVAGESGLPGAMQPIGGETAVGAFTAPICDFFIELFDLKENNWLRRQAIVIILQQILGSTIERKVRDSLKGLTTDESIERILGNFQEILWPGGERRPPSIPRTDEEKIESKLRASQKLALLIPDVAANMIGRGNARRAARRVFGALQDKRLNQHLMLCILDELIGALFSPVKQEE